MEEKRIYVIVAETVLNPLEMKYLGGKHFIMRPTPATKTIVQPIGRIGIQIGHVTSKMRMQRILESFERAIAKSRGHVKPAVLDDLRVMAGEAITSIAYSVPNSFDLEFRHYLLRKAGIGVFPFYDQNDEYGIGVVKTAISTVPVEASKLRGITDYLKLWGKPE